MEAFSQDLDKLTPIAIFILALVVVLKEPIGKFINRWPLIADFNMKHKADAVLDERGFEQGKELSVLRDRLKESEQARDSQREREVWYRNLILDRIKFTEDTLLEKVDGVMVRLTKVEQEIMSEIKSIKHSVDLLSKQVSD